MKGYYKKGLRKSIALRNPASFDGVLERFNKYVAFEESSLYAEVLIDQKFQRGKEE